MKIGWNHIEYISSPQNDKVKRTASLRDSKYRKRFKQFLIEGQREIAQALRNAFSCGEVYFSEAISKPEDMELLSSIRESNPHSVFYKLSEKAFAKLAVREQACPLVVVCQYPDEKQKIQVLLQDKEGPAFLLIIEGIEKPGNVGALLRTADGAGVDAVIALTSEEYDFFNPNAVRASLGAIFTVPCYSMTYQELTELRNTLNISIFAAALSKQAKFWHEMNFRQSCAILLGTEAHGLTDDALALSTHQIILPMLGKMDSLNVANAASAILYEVVRQRIV